MKCPICKGVGSRPTNVKNIFEVCSHCGGTGELPNHYHTQDGVPHLTDGGTGEVPQPAAGPWKPIAGIPSVTGTYLFYNTEKTCSISMMYYRVGDDCFIDDNANRFGLATLREIYTHISKTNLPGGEENR